MSGAEEDRRRAARAEQVALFRYQLIREAADPALSTRQRGRLVRELAARAHPGPFGDPVTRVAGHARPVDPGLAAGRVRRAGPAGPAGHAAHRRRRCWSWPRAEDGRSPARTAAQVQRILRAQLRLVAVGAHAAAAFRAAGADHPPGRARRRRPSAGSRRRRPNELWTGDALHGPQIAGRKTYLFAFLDDHSRAVMAARWGYFEDTVRLAAALRPALAARGVPERDLRR